MPNNPDEEAPKIRVNARFEKNGTFSVISAQLLEEVVVPPPKEEKTESDGKLIIEHLVALPFHGYICFNDSVPTL